MLPFAALLTNPGIAPLVALVSQKLPQATALIEQIGPKTLDQLAGDDLVSIAALFDVEILEPSRQMLDEVIGILRLDDIDRISDVLQTPELWPKVVDKLKTFASDPASDLTPVRCQFCNKISYI